MTRLIGWTPPYLLSSFPVAYTLQPSSLVRQQKGGYMGLFTSISDFRDLDVAYLERETSDLMHANAELRRNVRTIEKELEAIKNHLDLEVKHNQTTVTKKHGPTATQKA